MRKEELKKAIYEAFPEAYIVETEVAKGKETIEALNVFESEEVYNSDTKISPVLYPSRYDVAEEQWDEFVKHIKNSLRSGWRDIEKIAEKFKNPTEKDIRMVLRGSCDKNIPHRNFMNLEIIYRITVAMNGDFFSATINNEMAEKMGYTEADLFRIGLQNMEEPELGTFMQQMNLIQVPSCREGAVSMVRDDILKKAWEKFGNYFILPSSIHELIVLPDDGESPVETLREMVKTVNNTQLLPEDVLSNDVYYYDGNKIKVA